MLKKSALLVSFLFLILASCTQGQGDRCEIDNDCDDGLICCHPVGEAGSEGTCQLYEDCCKNDDDC
ncbi:MAG: hypothetical protein JXR95_03310 [Deltaproteobacteria bacterium]|nr:hypothetical protein [Deltaproteobacteria bacterium]